MRAGWCAPTVDPAIIDARCGELDYVTDTGRSLYVEYVINNKFAFGVINTSLVFWRWSA